MGDGVRKIEMGAFCLPMLSISRLLRSLCLRQPFLPEKRIPYFLFAI
jgi:hypothetical protein